MTIAPLVVAIALQLPFGAARREAEAALRRVPPDSPFVCRVYVPQVDVAPGMQYSFVVYIENNSAEPIDVAMPLGTAGLNKDWRIHTETRKEQRGRGALLPRGLETPITVPAGGFVLEKCMFTPGWLTPGRNRVTIMLQNRRQVMARAEEFEVVVE